MSEDGSGHVDGAVEISVSGPISGDLGFNNRHHYSGEASPLGGIPRLVEQREALVTVRPAVLDLGNTAGESREAQDEVVAGLLGEPQSVSGLC
ncbi:MAG: hypothetical protein ACLP3C_33780 [Mycobacterium sp.]|uniref:hypothetical protein n=1 Tax=Mycobacterium sp. TaxID=1785 RepID=UPI003C541526